MFEDETIQAFVGNLSQLSKSPEYGLDLRVEDGEGSARVFFNLQPQMFKSMRIKRAITCVSFNSNYKKGFYSLAQSHGDHT